MAYFQSPQRVAMAASLRSGALLALVGDCGSSSPGCTCRLYPLSCRPGSRVCSKYCCTVNFLLLVRSLQTPRDVTGKSWLSKYSTFWQRPTQPVGVWIIISPYNQYSQWCIKTMHLLYLFHALSDSLAVVTRSQGDLLPQILATCFQLFTVLSNVNEFSSI